ncbi:Lot5 protein [Saccharomycopsis crataegensis]|uniref:Protein LOT5 n=1 Tax=Saccharomycopsis crataegensis TaxID=43959 RepID=A0AAV5QJJ5_9ASCO|nr:Lot5 protein [Saccharomycopsis crataegensis]
MVTDIHLVKVKPSIENVDPFKKYQLSTPSTFSLQENPILYGGGRGWVLTIEDVDNSYFSSLRNHLGKDLNQGLSVDVFVLNTSFIMWFTGYGFGMEFMYPNIILHALQKNPENELMLYLQLKEDHANDTSKGIEEEGEQEIPIIEARLVPERKVSPEGNETLFTNEFFGGDNQGDKMVENTFNALSQCSAFHLDPQSEEELLENDEMSQEMPNFPIIGNTDSSHEGSEVLLNTGGQADDIDDDTAEDPNQQEQQISGIEVVIPGERLGVIRHRVESDEESDFHKHRKV